MKQKTSLQLSFLKNFSSLVIVLFMHQRGFIIGAIGAHLLQKTLTPKGLETFETRVQDS